MRVGKLFMMISAGCLCLALAWQLTGEDLLRPQDARAQFVGNVVDVTLISGSPNWSWMATTDTGDLYGFIMHPNGPHAPGTWALSNQTYLGNIVPGTIPNAGGSAGSLKGQFGDK